MLEEKKIFELADELKAKKELKKMMESSVKEVGREIEELDLALSDAMAESEVERFSRNGSTFYLSSRMYASPMAGMKEDLFDALKKQGFGSIVTETVNANTLASFIKEQMEQNNDEIPSWLTELVNTHEKVSVGIRKG